ncbi:S1 family peptidase [Pseudobacteriovorax antillogorgiicola]|uniref:Trypsin n=1 Tax=Pseudobacteriovorax antillogorgiicola TaxID=1513793 RepID=A0A1Y6BBZ6_9BACT|nr:trypsin-like serine protease [Pseudobacteriovorax antillogorgiicola]TCS57276.1 trypsin [Pseudobacteriovorax antillogorgiicola]SMF03186.1 Trypsin [Pseudobacteriovorax antillogorgiicola]
MKTAMMIASLLGSLGMITSCGSPLFLDQDDSSSLSIYRGELSSDPRLSSVVKVLRNQQFKCSGVAISKSYVLSAAHCFSACAFNNTRSCTLDNAKYQIQAESVTYDVEQVHVFPWQRTNNITRGSYDLAIVKLARYFQGGTTPLYNDRTEALSLLEQNRNRFYAPTNSVIAAGYGFANDLGENLGKLQVASMPFRGYYSLNNEELILGSLQVHPCSGDSGGPVMVQRSDGTLQLVGILSRGLTPDADGCRDTDGSLYTNLLIQSLYNQVQAKLVQMGGSLEDGDPNSGGQEPSPSLNQKTMTNLKTERNRPDGRQFFVAEEPRNARVEISADGDGSLLLETPSGAQQTFLYSSGDQQIFDVEAVSSGLWTATFESRNCWLGSCTREVSVFKFIYEY